MIRKYIILFFCIGLIISLQGCGFEELQNKTNKINQIILSKCDCDDVRLINYTQENFRTYAYFEIVGSSASSKKEIANKINDALKVGINDYCKIDEFTFDFINKGKHEIVTVRYCKIDE